MARARNIKPGFFKNEDLAECSVWARLLFPGLWMLADREGRIEDRPKRIKGEIFPFDAIEVDPLLGELVNWGFIRRYLIDGKRCIQINNFQVHQSPHGTEKDSDLPDESGVYTVNERAKNGCITGKTSKVKGSEGSTTVNQPLSNGEPTVNPPLDNALNPDSLNPDSLNPDSLNPESSSPAALDESNGAGSEKFSDDEKPSSPAEWVKVFAEQHGVDVDHRNIHDRKKFWPLASAWTNAGVTVGQMRSACAKAHEDAKEPIAWLPAYADRVLASMQCEKKPAKTPQQFESFKERDARIGRDRWEQMTGRIHPENMPKGEFIDASSKILEIET